MEEEQEDFAHDLANLKNEVAKLKELTKLSGAVKNAETVRRIKAALLNAEERSRVFNFRESLFNVSETEYKELNDILRSFEPFYDLWDSVEKWMSHKEVWTKGAFQELDSENVESTVASLLKNLSKSSKTFEKINLSQVNIIATQVQCTVESQSCLLFLFFLPLFFLFFSCYFSCFFCFYFLSIFYLFPLFFLFSVTKLYTSIYRFYTHVHPFILPL
jgi:cellulose synthase/poly-beta-1,6-N-acetylglucosamine synthase-like glycosyltransferase